MAKMIKILKAFPQYGVCENGFLYKLTKQGIIPMSPRISRGCSGKMRFRIVSNGKAYTVSQENLKAMQENVIFRMEK